MKKAILLTALMLIMIAGCGVNKDYVAQQIAESESRTDAKVGELRDQTDGNSAEIAKLQSLATQLGEKADMAINEAKGFENYQVIWSGEINFPFDSYDITETAATILNEAGDKMGQNPGAVIEIAGFTDRTGSSKYNLMLGQQRAEAAKLFLADNFGVSLYRMFIISFGENKPVAMPDEMEAASKNRRVTLKIWGKV